MAAKRSTDFEHDDPLEAELQASNDDQPTTAVFGQAGGSEASQETDLPVPYPCADDVGQRNVSRVNLQVANDNPRTFRLAFQDYFLEKRLGLSNKKHISQWESTMETYVFPRIGDIDVAEIGPGDILGILHPIWDEKPETADRVLGRIRNVLDASIADGYRTKANPCGAIRQRLGSGNREGRHHWSLPHPEIPRLILRLRLSRRLSMSKLALEFLILTVARSSEVRGATFDEIDCENALWTIPADRTRQRRPRQIPLSRSCLKIVAQAREATRGVGLLFPGRDGRSQLSDMAFNKLLERSCDRQKATAEGFRRSFETWCLEIDDTPVHARDAVLTRRINEIYARSEKARGILLAEIRELMRRWETYICDWKNIRT